MDYSVVVTEAAERDLNEILAYIANTLDNKTAARDFADALQEKYGQLEKFPLLFECVHDEFLRHKNYRRFVVKNYIVFYTADDTAGEVHIARIFYGRRDYERYL
jgi:plasmid stabilization system protein ParE